MKFFYFILLLIFKVATSVWAQSAQDILKRSDISRGGVNIGLIWHIEIKDLQGGREKITEFDVKAKGSHVLAKCTSPERQFGETYLFQDKNLWVSRPPRQSKPISVSTRQRLSGQTANGDIANTNYAKHYDADLLGTEELNGEKAHLLLLKAKQSDLTYDRIRYWVSVKRGVALQAEFLTTEGKPFKKATFSYKNTVRINGKDEPFVNEMVISESAFPENKSILIYSKLQQQDISDATFNIHHLSR